MDTAERVLALLGLLQSRRVWTGPEVAARLGVTTRTVRRDVERLRTLGYPVHAGQGVGGGYRLGAGQDLPPLLFDDEEAIAAAVALLAGADESASEAGLRALAKLDRVLPTRLRHEVRALSASVSSFGGGRVPVDRTVIMTLARACRDEVEAGFGYPTRDGAAGRRRVEPYRLVASDRRWYLFAYDLDRADWRTFRVDRMSEVAARTWRFRPRPAPDAAAYVQEAVASRVYAHQARFVVHAAAPVVRAQLPAAAAVVSPVDDTRCEVVSGAASLDFVLMHMVLLGHAFEVVEPPELTERCRVLADRLLAAARPAGPGPTRSAEEGVAEQEGVQSDDQDDHHARRGGGESVVDEDAHDVAPAGHEQ